MNNVREITILVVEPQKIKCFYKGEGIIIKDEILSQSLAHFLRHEAPYYPAAEIWLHRKNTNCGDLRLRGALE